MRFTVNDTETYASTGGRAHDPERPWVILLHGSGASHLAWLLQSRALAYDGYNVLAPDLPGHNLSGGEAIAGIAEQAAWLLEAMSAVDCAEAVLVGHSMGGLIAMEAAGIGSERVKGIVFVATAAEIPVNPQLIEAADEDEEAAFAAMMSWAHGPDAHIHDNTFPGGSQLFFGIDMMRLNAPGALAADLRSCARYKDGYKRASSLSCPTMCILAALDRMTPVSNGRKLADALPDNETVTIEGSGHTLPYERPREVNANLRRFIARVYADAVA